MQLTWDEAKRQANLQKHGLDFALAHEVLESRFRLDVDIERKQERRVLSMSYVMAHMAVLVVVHTKRAEASRLISFRRASREERRFTMSGLKTNAMNRKAVLDALRKTAQEKDYVRDGRDEDERPASQEEMQSGLEVARRRRGRPAGSGLKEQVAIRFDRDVLDAFRSSGAGWQTRMNAALNEWLKTHSLP